MTKLLPQWLWITNSLQTPLGGGILKVNELLFFFKLYFMSEKYKPSEDEIKKAENTMKKLGLEQRGKEEQVAFDAGRHSVLEISVNKFEKEKHRQNMEKLADKIGLSDEVKKLFIEDKVGYNHRKGIFYPSKELTEEQILELIDKLPSITILDACGPKVMTEEIIVKFFERFPDSGIQCFASSDLNFDDVRSKFMKIEEGLEGLIHISEMDWGLVDNPRKLFAVGDKLGF